MDRGISPGEGGSQGKSQPFLPQKHSKYSYPGISRNAMHYYSCRVGLSPIYRISIGIKGNGGRPYRQQTNWDGPGSALQGLRG
jgi:hypothetical protein